MRKRQRYTLPDPVSVRPGDTLKCSIWERRTNRCHVFTENIGRELSVDTIVTFDVDEPVLGLEEGVGAIFGRASAARPNEAHE